MQYISAIVQKRIVFEMSMHTFTIVTLLVGILHEAPCLVIKPDSITKGSLDQNINQNLHQYYYKTGPNITNVVTIEDNDVNYPYEEILQLVENTKRIIRSINASEKAQLNLDPSLYDNYLEGDLSDSNLDFNISPQIPPFASGGHVQTDHSYDSCPIDLKYEIPRRLRAADGNEYFIVNVGSKLRQKYNSIVCKGGRTTCGNAAAPQSYSYECVQSYNRLRNFISIPVNGPINLAQQRSLPYQLPDNCVCKSSRDIS